MNHSSFIDLEESTPSTEKRDDVLKGFRLTQDHATKKEILIKRLMDFSLADFEGHVNLRKDPHTHGLRYVRRFIS